MKQFFLESQNPNLRISASDTASDTSDIAVTLASFASVHLSSNSIHCFTAVQQQDVSKHH